MSKIEELAYKIKDLMVDNNIFTDTRIYFEGKCICSSDGLIEDINPSDYFEYANDNTLSMSFEGPFYSIMNYGESRGIFEKFSKLVEDYGYYAQPGHAWNLTLYE